MQNASRPTVIIGNWKMHKTIVEARVYVSSLAMALTHETSLVGIAVPYTMIEAAAEAARGTPILIGAQNLCEESEGPFTGEISSRQLHDAGASFVLIGHSERRHLFNEDDTQINKKIKKALNEGLRVVMCFGETIDEYQAGKTEAVISSQLHHGLKDLPLEFIGNLMLAYEPVWAIGTGKTASPQAVQSVHSYCRNVLSQFLGEVIAQEMVIQYGGSVKPENAEELLQQEDVDGLLVGGASLALDSFIKIIQSQRIKNS